MKGRKLWKENDFALFEKTIKTLTLMLEKNGFLKVEDKRTKGLSTVN